MTVYWQPLAAGGGTTEMMGYFNGVNYPGLFGWGTLIVKVLGLSFAVAAALCIGKEGVLAHCGSIVSHMIVYIPAKFTEYFRNNTDKRELAIAGTAAGVAAAFGSPIGGTLFAYEVASPCTGWTFLLTWKSFFSSCIAVFVLNICDSILHGEVLNITNAGVIKFGQYIDNPYKLYDFISFGIIGLFGGLLGSLFCSANYNLGKLRKKYLTTKPRKVFETLVLVSLSATLLFFAPTFIGKQCFPNDSSSIGENGIQY